MKAIYLVKNGKAESAFETREVSIPNPNENEVLIKSEAFGLNFADVMSRMGLYQDAPPIPCVLGYETVGRVESFGKAVTNFKRGQRVVAFTRFGSYAEYAVSDFRGVFPISDELDAGTACALATQYCTAWYAAEEMVNLQENDHVLVNAAAGGVGIALVQLAKRKKCIVYGTCGSDEKIEFLKQIGVDVPINYNKKDFQEE
ncbi:MAG TPA: alcohol dehydrogenase catalytic domain-containing protein, partial [Bacteroidia bacterium]